MAEEQSRQRTCDLSLVLSRYGGVHTWYDAKAGLKRRFILSGRIDDPYLGGGPDFSAPHFHNKPVQVEVSFPPDPAWLGEVFGTLDANHACGLVRVNADVESKRFDLDGEIVEEAPVIVRLEASADMFEALRRQAAEASDHHRIMWAKATLIGESLPEPDNRLGFIDLKDLDVSKDSAHAIGGFEIFDTRNTDHLRGRVLQMERSRDEGHGAYISILLTEARYEIHTERALVHSISCEGRVINGRGKPYDSVAVTIEFAEHEPNSYDELPERAFFGEFSYYVKLPDEKYSSTHFAFHLRYLPEDVRNLLIPLLNQETGTQVVLTVSLTNEEAEFLAAADKLQGDVRHYSFKVRKRLVDYDAALKRLEEAREQLEQRNLEADVRSSAGKGASEEHFQRIRRLLLAGGCVPNAELHSLSFEQIDALADELGW